MAHRLIVNVILTGASVFGRAFTEAYRQAAKASAASTQNSSVSKATSVGGIPVDEALKILDLKKSDLNLDKIDHKYKYLFDVNSKEKGNSFYLQSKIFYAMDTLRKELEHLEKILKAKDSKSGSTGDAGKV